MDRSTRRAALSMMALLFAGGCSGPSGELMRALTRWTFIMGHQGEGIVRFQASSEINGAQAGECRDPICRTTVDFGTRVLLTPVPAAGFRFKTWDGDPASHLSCPLDQVAESGATVATVESDGACVAVFETVGGPTTPTTPTTPGVR